jgi:hypothetical protein
MTGFSGANPYLEEVVKNNIQYIKKSKNINKYVAGVSSDGSVNIGDVFACYSEFILMKNLLTECLDIFNDNQINPIQQGSQTSTGSTITSELIYDLQESLSDLRDSMDNFLTESQISEMTTSFANRIVQEVVESKGYVPITDARAITAEYEKYVAKNNGSRVVSLYEETVQCIIDVNTGHPQGSKVIKSILVEIEVLKTSIVHSARLEVVGNTNKKNNTVQRLVQWNNLTPHEELLPFKDLMKKLIGVSCEEKDLTKACKIASGATEKIGFIVIYKIVKTPMEHRIMSLIDKNLSIDANAGINTKIYERTQTIRVLPSPHGSDAINVYNNEHVESSEMNYFYIVETLDGNTFRVLHPWGVHTTNFKIPASWVQNMSDPKRTPSRRLAGYSDIINENILKHLQNPILPIDFMSRSERIKADIKWKNIKENITRELLKEFDEKISKQNIAKLIASDKFQRAVVHNIVVQLEKQTSTATSATDDSGQAKEKTHLYYEEMSISYLKDLDAIQGHLGRELINVYQKEIKNSSGSSVASMFSDLMNRVLSKILGNKSNIFNTMQYKSELLTKTLLN